VSFAHILNDSFTDDCHDHIHGHNMTIILELCYFMSEFTFDIADALNPDFMVMDFTLVKSLCKGIHDAIDHRYLFNEPCILFVSKPICTDCVKLVTAHRFIKGVCWLNDIEFAQRWNVNKSVEMLERHFKSTLVTTPEYSYISKATDK
jgi:6-pyruvoyl-tetrahydropterin synthase